MPFTTLRTAALVVALACCACSSGAPSSEPADLPAAVPAPQIESSPAVRAQDQPFSWDDATIYFLLLDRFAEGDPSNNDAYGRGLDGEGQPYAFDSLGHFHGGDLAGLTEQIEAGYFDNLGVDALWISSPLEQIHGWVGGGRDGDIQGYAYHGYWMLDPTQIDAAFGTRSEFAAMIEAAHARGLRILLDVVVNHVGYNTLHDMAQFDFGVLKSDEWRTWRPSAGETWHSYHEPFIEYDAGAEGAVEAWSRWWSPAWLRAGLPGHASCGESDIALCLNGLPDVRTEASALLTTEQLVPPVLAKKWGAERTARERREIAAFLAEANLAPTPANVLVKWLVDWVRAYGIDGYRVDTAKHVELAVWDDLAREGQRALAEWRAAHPDRHLQGDAPFWVVGEVFGAGVERTDYFDNGFDAVINFAYKHNLYRALDAGGGELSPAVLDSLYTSIAARIHPDPTFNALHYISSHDTDLFARDKLMQAGTALLLAPGAVQIYYGDETARPPGLSSSDPDAHTRSPMNWSDIEDGAAADSEARRVLAHWRALGQFRQRHPAVGLGAHEAIAVPASGEAKPYVFARRHRLPDGREDAVMVALVPKALRSRPIMLPASRTFADDALVRDAVTGQVALVSYGQIRLIAGESGVVLLEEAAQ